MKPLHPRLVLLIGLLLPCVGQLVNRQNSRAMMFLFFAILLGWVTINMITPEVCTARSYTAWRCFFVQHTGVIFIWLVAAVDAYHTARVRYEEWRFKENLPQE